ncbi:MAG: helix-turn-helix transcriptional regulator [Treponema sp.]|nr:helix-turn-helix transcriptional regulator [Treponema sp.]
MTSIRDILAHNMKEKRKKLGFSQAKLAEKANVTTQYIAMIEVSRKFPTPEMLDRLAVALEIETYQFFSIREAPEDAMEQLRMSIVKDIDQVIADAVKKAIAENCGK